MSVRFQVLFNGTALFVSGVPGEGVLAVGLDRVQRRGEEKEKLSLHASGLGRYHPELADAFHVNWEVPENVGVGDEVTIRILPPGDYDDPANVRRSPSAEVDDPVFGLLKYNVSAWDGVMPFDFAPSGTTHLRVHIRGSEDGPSEVQRELFQEFRSRYAQLWPAVAESLRRCHPRMTTVDEVNQRLDPTISMDLSESPGNELVLRYQFDIEDDRRAACFVTIRDWQVVEISRPH